MEGSRRRGRQGKSSGDNIKEWTGQLLMQLLRIANDKSRQAAITALAYVGLPNNGRRHVTIAYMGQMSPSCFLSTFLSKNPDELLVYTMQQTK